MFKRAAVFETAVKDKDDSAAASAAALKILNGAAQSSEGLRLKLLRRGFSAEACATAVAQMVGYGYVNDAELALSVARRSQLRGHGRRLVASDLRSHNVDEEASSAAMEVVTGEGDYEIAQRLADGWWLASETLGRDARRRRIAGRLQRRGFDGDVINRVLRDLATTEQI